MSFSLVEVIKARRSDRIFVAAIGIYLGAYVPPTLDADKQRRIREQIDKMRSQMDPSPWSACIWYMKAAFFAAAMARLDLDPMPGLKWTEFYDPRSAQPITSFQWGIWPLVPDPLPGLLVQHFHPYHPSTEDARKSLRLAGYDVPDRDPVIP